MRGVVQEKQFPQEYTGQVKKFAFHIPAHTYQNLLIVDPAKTVRAESAESGYVVFGVSEVSPYILIHASKGLRLNPRDVIAQAIQLVREYNCTHLCVEVTSLNLWVAEPFRQALLESGVQCELVEVQARGDKLMRIATLAPWYYANKVLHNMNGTTRLEEQLNDFPYGRFVDVCDAAGHITGILSLLNFTPMPQEHSEQALSTSMPIPLGNGLTYMPAGETPSPIKESYI